jgi:hypothetical protein
VYIIDARTNHASFINVIEQINPQGFPTIMPKFFAIRPFRKK